MKKFFVFFAMSAVLGANALAGTNIRMKVENQVAAAYFKEAFNQVVCASNEEPFRLNVQWVDKEGQPMGYKVILNLTAEESVTRAGVIETTITREVVRDGVGDADETKSKTRELAEKPVTMKFADTFNGTFQVLRVTLSKTAEQPEFPCEQ